MDDVTRRQSQPIPPNGDVPPPGTYALDPFHTFVTFGVRHLVLGKVHGRFDVFKGGFTIGDNPKALLGRFETTIDASSVDTQVKKRDDDLRSPRFFDVKTYPTIAFRGAGGQPVSTNRRAVEALD